MNDVIRRAKGDAIKELLEKMDNKPAGTSFFKILRDYQLEEVKKKYNL